MVTGEYNQVFGIMNIDDDCSEKNCFKGELKPAILHEEIHYLQNYSTLYGVNMSIEVMSELLKSFEDVRKGKLLTLNSEEDFVKTSFDVIEGDNKQIRCHSIEEVEYKRFLKEFYSEVYGECLTNEYDTVILKFHSGNDEYLFGGAAICESMAYLFEVLVFEVDDYSRQFPYNACEMIYEYYWNKKCEDVEALIFLCFISLMHRYPGVTFSYYMKSLADEKIFSLQDILRLYYNKIHYISEEQIAHLNDRIDFLFPSEFDEVQDNKLFSNYYEKIIKANRWLKEQYGGARKAQETVIKTLYSLLEINDIEFKRKCLQAFLLKYYGKPVIYDCNGKLYDDDESRLMLFAPLVLYKYLIGKEKGCLLYKICKNYNNKYENICEMDLLKHKTKDSVCLVRFYLYIMGLEDVDL